MARMVFIFIHVSDKNDATVSYGTPLYSMSA